MDKSNSSTASYPKFLIISTPTNELDKLSPFFIQKALLGIGGNPKSIKKLKSGALLIETSSQLQSKSFLSSRNLGHVPIDVLPHSTLNSSRGVISEVDLQHVSENEITQELSAQGVTHAKRITIKKGLDIISTKHVILTFNSPELPKNIKAGYLYCSVRPYIPNPLRCFQCQRFGHSKISCRGSLTCSQCSTTGHSFESCNAPSKCKNCSGSHPSNSKSCPIWQTEKEIQKIKVSQNLSYPEARKIVLSSLPVTLPAPYSSVLKPKTVSASTQTDTLNGSLPTSMHPIVQNSKNEKPRKEKDKTRYLEEILEKGKQEKGQEQEPLQKLNSKPPFPKFQSSITPLSRKKISSVPNTTVKGKKPKSLKFDSQDEELGKEEDLEMDWTEKKNRKSVKCKPKSSNK